MPLPPLSLNNNHHHHYHNTPTMQRLHVKRTRYPNSYYRSPSERHGPDCSSLVPRPRWAPRTTSGCVTVTGTWARCASSVCIPSRRWPAVTASVMPAFCVSPLFLHRLRQCPVTSNDISTTNTPFTAVSQNFKSKSQNIRNDPQKFVNESLEGYYAEHSPVSF